MKTHDVQKHGTLIVQTDPNAEEVWNDIGLTGMRMPENFKGAYDFDPRDMANLSSIKLAMSNLSEQELQAMAKNGLQAIIALKILREKPITTEEVSLASLPTHLL